MNSLSEIKSFEKKKTKENLKQREIISAGNVYTRNEKTKVDTTIDKIIFYLTFIVDTITDDPIFPPFCPALLSTHLNKVISLP